MARKNNAIKLVFNPDEFKWTKGLVYGEALLVLGGTMDSFGKKTKPGIQYKVGKHKKNGYTVIIPEDQIESVMKKNDNNECKGQKDN